MTEVTKDVEVTRVVEPRFLTLTGKPANQIAFKVIRDDNGEPTMTAPHIQRKRTKRSEALLAITFDADTSDEDIASKMSEWGIDGYEIEAADDKKKKAVCRRADEGVATMDIRLDSGVVATVLKPISNQENSTKSALAVVRVDFAADYFETVEDVSSWMAGKSIDFSDTDVENGDQAITVRRCDVPEGTESRRIKVDDGVTFVVVRSEEEDIPEGYVAVVNDTAYGMWGWGQLDFTAAMADDLFCSRTRDAMYYLSDVLERIIFYSDLPVNPRKDLIRSALTQFGDYVVALLDALPARVVIANRSILEKEKSMSKEKENNQSEQQSAAQGTGDATETTTTDTISRADVEALIGQAVSGLSAQLADLKATLSATTATQESTSEATQRGDKDESGKDKPDANTEALQAIMRSVQELTSAVGGVVERVQSLESTTVVRSDEGDGKQVERKDVFQGMFGGKAKA